MQVSACTDDSKKMKRKPFKKDYMNTERTEKFLSYLVIVIALLSMVAILSITCQSAIEIWGN